MKKILMFLILALAFSVQAETPAQRLKNGIPCIPGPITPDAGGILVGTGGGFVFSTTPPLNLINATNVPFPNMQFAGSVTTLSAYENIDFNNDRLVYIQRDGTTHYIFRSFNFGAAPVDGEQHIFVNAGQADVLMEAGFASGTHKSLEPVWPGSATLPTLSMWTIHAGGAANVVFSSLSDTWHVTATTNVDTYISYYWGSNGSFNDATLIPTLTLTPVLVDHSFLSRQITGIVNQSVLEGYGFRFVSNSASGAAVITFKHNSTSTAQYRLSCTSGADITMVYGEMVDVVYRNGVWKVNKVFQGLPSELPVQYFRRTATQTVTDSTTLTADNTFSANVVSGKTYQFKFVYYLTAVATSGVQVDLSGGGATVSALRGDVTITNEGTYAQVGGGILTSLGSVVGVTVTDTSVKVEIQGSFIASSTGTFKPRFAQNAETGASESVSALIDSFGSVWRTSN